MHACLQATTPTRIPGFMTDNPAGGAGASQRIGHEVHMFPGASCNSDCHHAWSGAQELELRLDVALWDLLDNGSTMLVIPPSAYGWSKLKSRSPPAPGPPVVALPQAIVAHRNDDQNAVYCPPTHRQLLKRRVRRWGPDLQHCVYQIKVSADNRGSRTAERLFKVRIGGQKVVGNARGQEDDNDNV
jgi:hypothetical protein